ncbi:2-keto-4-pentenoate hydratase [Novosphingobium jiangmenense]|uniref:Fumarylacetoacetate hydrolase family protein n=1 Tax=Novosphingobium jiangmenense TaxID=2791981 RepID=A0ABS0HBR2_9SPHN|nr:fumarylacetoacetate hydrolase family protein [Novosphingobium jiangmenense]MBF9149621.1 fumarylacetoacetate hydrolase family protein [Novosphingobium jiangmenense]
MKRAPIKVPDIAPSLAEAYDIQRAVFGTSGLPVTVWKLALTSDPVREQFGAAEPAVGRLSASAILNPGTEARQTWPELYAEAEIVFQIGQDLPPTGTPYTRETVLPAIRAVHGGIELAASRYLGSSAPLKLFVADNAMAHAIVAGSHLAAGWEPRFGALPVSIQVNGELIETGSSSRVMGNPLDALVWLANWLCENGEGGLRRDQLVSSGSCTGATPVKAGDVVTADFGDKQGARITIVD